MKKNYLKLTGLSLAIALLISSCMPEGETPMTSEAAKLANEVADAGSQEGGFENLRKSPNGVAYQEKFTNSIGFVPAEGFNPDLKLPAFYPGTGVGNATYMGKAYSFINQRAEFGPQGPVTVGAPVTMFFAEQLANEFGLTNIPDEVSSLTTDGKGNTIYFKNILNVTSPVSETRINFTADVEIIGGTGKFETASGMGKVVGFFNPGNGAGETTLRATIVF
ncbi:hypothetical protein ACFPIK_03090 [Algoriphagus aquatilis]|uniref:Transferrin-binding protein B C-lobe/N-lobe beta barrel domain-containing protein n=1 Tax=Algoriphagus aquatilis TaxID=490186 RepID=A0ABW0BSZ1_9BACT